MCVMFVCTVMCLEAGVFPVPGLLRKGSLPSRDDDWQEGLPSICSNSTEATKRLLSSHTGRQWN